MLGKIIFASAVCATYLLANTNADNFTLGSQESMLTGKEANNIIVSAAG